MIGVRHDPRWVVGIGCTTSCDQSETRPLDVSSELTTQRVDETKKEPVGKRHGGLD